MEEEEVFNLRWSNYQKTVMNFFDSLLQTETLVDVTLASEGKCLRAHRLVLSAYSDYFKELLTFQCEKHAILYLRDVPFPHLEALVAFMYRGEVNISQAELPKFIQTSESLRIRGLSESYHHIQELANQAVNKHVETSKSPEETTSTVLEATPSIPKGSPVGSSVSSVRQSKRLRSKSQKDAEQPVAVKRRKSKVVSSNRKESSARNIHNAVQSTQLVVNSSDVPRFSPESNSRVPMVSIHAPTWDGNSLLDYTLSSPTKMEQEVQEVDLGTLDLDDTAGGAEEDWSDMEGLETSKEESEGLQTGGNKISCASVVQGGSKRRTYVKKKGNLLEAIYESKCTLVVTGTGEKRFQCRKCSKNYKHRRDALRHCNYECDCEPRYRCPFCSCKSRRKYKLRSHILSRHNKFDLPYDLKSESDSHE